ncbi:MAG: hypothetical protein GY764_08125 [Halieaceae bacterium]|nr:hypothetical protein [Halieaceae bacterium]
MGEYRYAFVSINDFVRRVANDIVRYGYELYVTGHVPEGMAPERVDAAILGKYDCAVSRWTRARREKAGGANIHYVRHQDFYVMFAKRWMGESRWFQNEEWPTSELRKEHGRKIRSIRRQPLVHCGYSISLKHCSRTQRDHVAVRIAREEYRALMSYYVQLGMRCSLERIDWELEAFPFLTYAGIRLQRERIVREVNRVRKRAGLFRVSC